MDLRFLLSGALTISIALFGNMLMDTSALAINFTDLLKADIAPKKYTYKTAGGGPVSLYVFSPADLKRGERRAAAVWIHGGAWMHGEAEAFFPHARYCASRGMIGISIDYRLLGHGAAQLGDCISDCKSALRYLRAHADELLLDPGRIAVLGDSAGGHLAACLAMTEADNDPGDDLTISPKPNLLIICNGVLDLTGPKWIPFALGERSAKESTPEPPGTPTAAEVEKAKTLSPLFLVKPGLPPTLVMHGLDDTVVEPRQAEEFAAKMRAGGNPCDLILLAHARHAFIVARYTASEADVVERMQTIDRYLAAHGYVRGKSSLEVSPTPAWLPK